MLVDDALYLMAGGGERADWVRNMRARPSVHVRIGGTSFAGMAEVAPGGMDGRPVREAMAAKYQGWEAGAELSRWAQEALVVRIHSLQAAGGATHPES